jgi:predicted lipoprotein with Yx(FWY)xxD motif
MMKKVLLCTAVAAIAATLATAANAGTASQAQTGTSRKTVVITTRRLPKLGTVLVDGKGRTLYMFIPDKRRRVTCTGTCAAIWPPVKLATGQKVVAEGKAKGHLLAHDRDPAGGIVVTYNRWPLYTYVGDNAAGQAKGQALNLNGGLWYVIAPSGKVIRKRT